MQSECPADVELTRPPVDQPVLAEPEMEKPRASVTDRDRL